MIKLYLMEASPFLDVKNRERALALSAEDRRERAALMKQEKDRALSTAAGLLLSYAVAEFSGMEETDRVSIPEKVCKKKPGGIMAVTEVKAAQAFVTLSDKCPVKIKKAPGGKPFLESPRGLFFNLSHSGDYAVCAVSDREVGVDIQKEQHTFRLGLLNRVLHEEEKASFFTGREQKAECSYVKQEPEVHMFFQIWAAKEAFVKCTGEGLAKDFKELLTDFSKGEIIDIRTGQKCRIYINNTLPGYQLAVCVPYADFTKKG